MDWNSISAQHSWGELREFQWGELQFCKYEALINPQNSSAPLPPEIISSLGILRDDLISRNPAHAKILNVLGINNVKDLLEFIITCYTLYKIAEETDLINKFITFCDIVDKIL